MDKTHLKLRGVTWYARLIVPAEFRGVLGREEYVRSLRTRDGKIANVRKHAVLAQLQQQMSREIHRVQGTPESVASLRIQAATLKMAVAAREMDEDTADRILDAGADEIIAQRPHEVSEDEVTGEMVLSEDLHEELSGVFRVFDGRQEGMLSACFDQYMKEQEGHIRHQTLNEKRRLMTEFQKWIKKDVLLSSIHKRMASSYVENVLCAKGHKPKTIQDAISHLGAFFKWATVRGHSELNPFERVGGTIAKSKRGELLEKVEWTESQLHKVLGVTGLRTSDPLWSMSAIALCTGMRLEEISSLRIDHVMGDHIEVIEGKTESARRNVPIHPVIDGLIKRLVEDRRDEYLIPGLLRAGVDDKRGTYIGKRFGVFKKKAGFGPEVTFHTFRHSYINCAEVMGVPEPTIQLIVGHKRQSLAYGRYSRKLPVSVLLDATRAVSFGSIDDIVRGAGSMVTVDDSARRRGRVS